MGKADESHTNRIEFPNPELADPEGLVAYGGNLEIETLLAAYSQGIFPWFNEGSPILWWSPDPRLVLFPDKLKISKSFKQKINRNIFDIRFDTNFEQVIHYCSSVRRKNQDGTWITGNIQKAYIKLHHKGYAHSVETYFEENLVGGLYGVSIGAVFFGESMFHLMTDASKIALFYLVEKLKQWKFHFIDAQQSTHHLKSLGAEEVQRKKFLSLLASALRCKSKVGRWN